MNTKFIHIRPGVTYDSTSKKLVGTPSPKGGVTIAFTYDELSRNIDVSIARCHDRDSYSRVRGRQIAGGRLHKGLHDMLLSLPYSKGIVEHVVSCVGAYLEDLYADREAT